MRVLPQRTVRPGGSTPATGEIVIGSRTLGYSPSPGSPRVTVLEKQTGRKATAERYGHGLSKAALIILHSLVRVAPSITRFDPMADAADATGQCDSCIPGQERDSWITKRLRALQVGYMRQGRLTTRASRKTFEVSVYTENEVRVGPAQGVGQSREARNQVRRGNHRIRRSLRARCARPVSLDGCGGTAMVDRGGGYRSGGSRLYGACGR